MQRCEQCGKELNKWQQKKYCSIQCSADSRFGAKVEWNGLWIRPGKMLEVLKLCGAGLPPVRACQTAGASYDAIKRLKKIPEAVALLPERTCPVCGKEVPPPLKRKYCCNQCSRKAQYARAAAIKGIPPRFIDRENRQKTFELYRRGFDCGSIAELINIPYETVGNRVYHSDVWKEFRPTRHQLEHAQTADERAEILRDSGNPPERSDRVILVCARLRGTGAPGRYISIAAQQFWNEDFYNGSRVAFCSILKNAITTIEWSADGDNFRLTRIFKISGTFVWPDEKLGRSIEVTSAEFDHLISLKKHRKSAKNACIHSGFMIQSEYEKQP
jgi:hypothetical protein